MRIASFAFYSATTRRTIYDACLITHQNEDAYAGALAVYLAIKAAINHTWNGHNNLFDVILPNLPDTNLKDRLLDIDSYSADSTIAEISQLGNNGYAVNSVPFAIFCATKTLSLGLEEVLRQVIATGGDTDTNASIVGQIAGSLLGLAGIPPALLQKLKLLPEFDWLRSLIDKCRGYIYKPLFCIHNQYLLANERYST